MDQASANPVQFAPSTHKNTASRLPVAVSVAAALAAGLALRVWMLFKFPQINGDSLIYGGLAKNLLLHGQFAITDGSGIIHPTLIRLPGYPLFLAACFRLFGMENYFAVSCVQFALDLAACLLLADFVRRISSSRAAHCTLWLAALCPFTAIYASAPLTETPTLFVIALALWSIQRFREKQSWLPALLFTFAASYAALLRPDGALVGICLAPALVIGLRRRHAANENSNVLKGPGFSPAANDQGLVTGHDLSRAENDEGLVTGHDLSRAENDQGLVTGHDFSRAENARNEAWASAAAKDAEQMKGTGFSPYIRPEQGEGALAPEANFPEPAAHSAGLIQIALVCLLLALTPFALWTARNWRVFHVIEPLAPRYATDPGEDIHAGWQRWVKTWCLDFVSTYYVYWNVPGDKFNLDQIPARAFDSPAQYAKTAALAQAYEDNGEDLSPELDAQFAALAQDRISAHPLRYYVWLPLGRLADMWLRPRVENLPIDYDWWVYANHNAETRFSWFYAALNAIYIVLGIVGLCLRPRFWPYMLAYFILRSALLATIEAPEARYTLECFPMLFALGGIALYRFTNWVLPSVLNVKASLGSD